MFEEIIAVGFFGVSLSPGGNRHADIKMVIPLSFQTLANEQQKSRKDLILFLALLHIHRAADYLRLLWPLFLYHIENE